MKKNCFFLLIILTFSVCFIYSKDILKMKIKETFKFPIKKEISKIIYKPGYIINPIINEKIYNSAYIISAPENSNVFAVEDGVVCYYSYFVTSPDFKWSCSSYNYNDMVEETKKSKASWKKKENIFLGIGLKVKDGIVWYEGLVIDTNKIIKTGKKIKKGDTIGKVGYLRVLTNRPCIGVFMDSKKYNNDIGIPLLNEDNKLYKLWGKRKIYFTKNEVYEAIDIFRKTLEEGHPSLYCNTNKKKFDLLFQKIKKSIKEKTTNKDFFQLIAPIVSGIGCSHTYLTNIEEQKSNSVFPFWMSLLEQKCVVVGHKEMENILPKGTEILKINNISISEIIEKIKKVLYNDIQTNECLENVLESPFFFNWSFKTSYNLYFDKTFDIEYKDVNGETKKTIVKSCSDTKKLPSDFAKNIFQIYQEEYRFKRIDKDIAYFSLQTCEIHETIKEKINAIVDTVINENFKNLIIDIRNNRGGNDVSYLAKLFTNEKYSDNEIDRMVKSNVNYKLLKNCTNYSPTDTLFKEYKPIPNKEGFWKIAKQSKDTLKNEKKFKGKIYVLVGSGVQSYGIILASILEKDGAILVGEETGGSKYHLNAETYAKVKLGETDIELNLPLTKLVMREFENSNTQNRGIIPQYKVHQTINGLVNDEDVQLKYCINLINKGK